MDAGDAQGIVAAMGRVLGPCVHTLCWEFPVHMEARHWCQTHWCQLLDTLPRLAVVHTGQSQDVRTALSTACQVAQRHMLVQVNKNQVSVQQAKSLGNDWVRVNRV